MWISMNRLESQETFLLLVFEIWVRNSYQVTYCILRGLWFNFCVVLFFVLSHSLLNSDDRKWKYNYIAYKNLCQDELISATNNHLSFMYPGEILNFAKPIVGMSFFFFLVTIRTNTILVNVKGIFCIVCIYIPSGADKELLTHPERVVSSRKMYCTQNTLIFR